MTTEAGVCAVVRARGSARAVEATLQALGSQTVPLSGTICQDASFHDGLERARHESPSAEWFWLLDAGVAPAPDALEQLLAAAEIEELPRPVLVASKVLRPDGEIDEERAPWPPLLDREVVIAAARRRLVSLRLVRWGSTLVRAEALEAHGLPRRDYDGGADDMEWTARLLRDERGYLAPRSVATHHGGPPADPALAARDRARMVRGEGWVAQEPVWFAFMLVVDVLRALRAHPRLGARLVRGLLAEGARP